MPVLNNFLEHSENTTKRWKRIKFCSVHEMVNALIYEACGSGQNEQYIGNCLFNLDANRLISGLPSRVARALLNSVRFIIHSVSWEWKCLQCRFSFSSNIKRAMDVGSSKPCYVMQNAKLPNLYCKWMTFRTIACSHVNHQLRMFSRKRDIKTPMSKWDWQKFKTVDRTVNVHDWPSPPFRDTIHYHPHPAREE